MEGENQNEGPFAGWGQGAQPAPLVIVWTDDQSRRERIESMLRMLGFECALVEQMSPEVIALAERSAVGVVTGMSPDSGSPLSYLRTAGLSLPILMLCDPPDPGCQASSDANGPALCAALPRTARELGTILATLAGRSAIGEQVGDGFWLDPVGLRMGYREEMTKLQSREAALLHWFGRHAGMVMTPASLWSGAWGASSSPRREARIIAVHVCHLRRKLKEIGLAGVIQTVKASGYRFELPK